MPCYNDESTATTQTSPFRWYIRLATGVEQEIEIPALVEIQRVVKIPKVQPQLFVDLFQHKYHR